MTPSRALGTGRDAAGRLPTGGPHFLCTLVLLLWSSSVWAQSFHLGPVAGDVMGQVIGIVTTAGPMPHDATLTEADVVQPVVSLGLGAFGGHLRFRGTLDLEGWTIPDGELTPGAWGEGYVDKRHPHTYAHELMLTAHDVLGHVGGPAHLSLAFGKGFVAFGTDDPMSRPPVLYPIDHHLSQILEREVAIVGVATGPAALEVSWFDGDEPEYPSEWPNGRRFGDSYALRATVVPWHGIETQVSFAEVKSPEQRQGAGVAQDKWSASARFTGPVLGHAGYALADWARTSEANGAFVFQSGMLEAAMTFGSLRPYLRLERTDRPEEPRAGDDFHTPRPLLDNSLLGITRWTVATLGSSVTALTVRRRFTVAPFLEAAIADVRTTSGNFDVVSWYGSHTLLSVSVGVRVDLGMSGHRMGRYGTGIDWGNDAMPMPEGEGP